MDISRHDTAMYRGGFFLPLLLFSFFLFSFSLAYYAYCAYSAYNAYTAYIFPPY